METDRKYIGVPKRDIFLYFEALTAFDCTVTRVITRSASVSSRDMRAGAIH